MEDDTPRMSALFTGLIPFSFMYIGISFSYFAVSRNPIMLSEIFHVSMSIAMLVFYKFVCLNDAQSQKEDKWFSNLDKQEKSKILYLILGLDIMVIASTGWVISVFYPLQ